MLYHCGVLYILKLIKVCVLPKVHWAVMLVEWRWSIMDVGEQSVIVVGTTVMARWSAGMFFESAVLLTNPEVPSYLCRMLNFHDVVCAVTSGTHVFGEGTGHVWLADLSCYYGSLTLNNCGNNIPRSTNPCPHSQDAAVICQGKCNYLPSMHANTKNHLLYVTKYVCWLSFCISHHVLLYVFCA